MKRIKESEVVTKRGFRPSRIVMFQKEDGEYSTFLELVAGEGSSTLTHGVFYGDYEEAAQDFEKRVSRL